MPQDPCFLLTQEHGCTLLSQFGEGPTVSSGRNCSGRNGSGLLAKAWDYFYALWEKQRPFLDELTEWPPEDIGPVLVDPDDTILHLAAGSGAMKNREGASIMLEGRECRLQLKGCPEEKEIWTLSVRLLDAATGAPYPRREGTTPVHPVSPRFLLQGTALIPSCNLGGHWKELDGLGSAVTERELPLFLSLALSLFPDLDIHCDGYTTRRGPSQAAGPGILFTKLDILGRLHLKPLSGYQKCPAGFTDIPEISRIAKIDKNKQIITTAPLKSSPSPLREFQKLLQSPEPHHHEPPEEHAGSFILTRETALRVLRRHRDTLLASFYLYRSKDFSRPQGRSTAASPWLQLPHGVNFFEEYPVPEGPRLARPWKRTLSDLQNSEILSLPFPEERGKGQQGFAIMLRSLKRKRKAVCLDDCKAAIPPGLKALCSLQGSRNFRKGMGPFLQTIESLDRKGDPDFTLAESSLRPYQIYGVRWMEHLGRHEVGGCLADEMGLGKTVQVIALLRRFRRTGSPLTALVVVPKSLLHNWSSEFSRFAPEIPLHFHYGKRRRASALGSQRRGVILTTYATLRLDIDTLDSRAYSHLILDEAQHIKNPKARISLTVLRLQARQRLALSGTPMENNLSELYSLFRFLNPGLFGRKARFSSRFGYPIQDEQDPGAGSELRLSLYPFMLRRLKRDVLSLPAKREETRLISLDRSHFEVYHRRRASLQAKIAWAIRERGFVEAAYLILKALSELRRLAAVPESDGEHVKPSRKRLYLLDSVRKLRADKQKCLVFSSYLAVLALLSDDLKRCGIKSLVMTGATGNRQELVQRFQEDPEAGVFLMTLKTGGVGLNLTAAGHVFLFDPWWNRAAEDQAIDRTHRIGQTQRVECVRLIARTTIEEKILKLQERKSNLTAECIASDGAIIKTLSEEDIRLLLEA